MVQLIGSAVASVFVHWQRLLVGSMSSNRTIPLKFWNFLLEVDAASGVQREESFLQTAAGAFMNNSTFDQLDLVGFEVGDAKKGAAQAVMVPCLHLR